MPHKSKANPKFLFWSLIFLVMFVVQTFLSVVLIFASILLHRWVGVWYKIGGYAGGLVVPIFMIAFICVCAIGRRFGFVEPRRTETLRRNQGPLPAASVETFELRTPESSRKQLVVVLLIIGCLIATIPFLSDTKSTQSYAFTASGVFIALGLLALWFGKSDALNFIARIDRNGITAYQGFRKHAAAWQEIEKVEILTLSGAPGAPVTRTYALFGRDTKRLFLSNLMLVPPAEQEKFVRILREVFGEQSNPSEMTI